MKENIFDQIVLSLTKDWDSSFKEKSLDEYRNIKALGEEIRNALEKVVNDDESREQLVKEIKKRLGEP